LQVVVASRVDPPLPLARLRVRGQLVELRERDLRFTFDEAAALLRDGAGLDLPTASLAALSTRTEGWVAGLQLAVLSLQGRSDPAGFVTSFSGSHRFVLDYLTEEVLARQPDQLVRFLLETSILDQLSGPLCNAVTAETDSQQRLEQVERANLFLVPLDEERRWWRYHRLFADLLRARLHQTHPAGCQRSTAMRPPGWRPTGWSMRPCVTLWPPGRSTGPPGWSSSTPRSASNAARAPRWTAGWRRCPPSWSMPGRG